MPGLQKFKEVRWALTDLDMFRKGCILAAVALGATGNCLCLSTRKKLKMTVPFLQQNLHISSKKNTCYLDGGTVILEPDDLSN